jgi:hypothetical protein
MSNWILGPIDHRSEIWKSYPVRRVVVEAPSERAARLEVAGCTPASPQPNPWLDSGFTSCDEIEAPDVLLSRSAIKMPRPRPGSMQRRESAECHRGA